MGLSSLAGERRQKEPHRAAPPQRWLVQGTPRWPTYKTSSRMLVGGRPARRPPWTDPAAGRGCASLSNKHSALGSSVGRGIRAFLGHEQLRLSRLPQQRDPRPARRAERGPPGPTAERLRRRLPLGSCLFVRLLQDRSPFSTWGTCSESRLCGRLPRVSVRVAGALSPPPSAGPTPAVAPDSPGDGHESRPWQNGP